MNRRRLMMASLALLVAGEAMMRMTSVSAGEFFEAEGLALRGYDPVAYFTEGRPVAGSPAFVASYRGSTFRFASDANRKLFLGDPERYAPQYGGFCAFGTAGGYKAAIDPNAFTIVDGKLYLNYSAAVQTRWRSDRKDYIAKADGNWPAVSQQTDVAQ
jgi:YHS domain-containing protein